MSAYIYVEGGGSSKELRARCREGFRRLLENAGFAGRMPRLVACGSREDAFQSFNTAHGNMTNAVYVAMLIDSGDPVDDIEATWGHLMHRDGWSKPDRADDEHVLLMVTCMETWILTDRDALRSFYGARLQESALPPLNNMEARHRHEVQEALEHATRSSSKAYVKSKRSFELIARLNPGTLSRYLPSFDRLTRILDAKL